MSSDKGLAAANKELIHTAINASRLAARTQGTPLNLFSGLEGQDLFIAGHRFHIIGTLRHAEVMDTGETVATLDGVFQIDHDENNVLAGLFALGDGFRIPESAVGWAVQPVAGRPRAWQDSWAKAKAKLPTRPQA